LLAASKQIENGNPSWALEKAFQGVEKGLLNAIWELNLNAVEWEGGNYAKNFCMALD
jgi:hypothetical protein